MQDGGEREDGGERTDSAGRLDRVAEDMVPTKGKSEVGPEEALEEQDSPRNVESMRKQTRLH